MLPTCRAACGNGLWGEGGRFHATHRAEGRFGRPEWGGPAEVFAMNTLPPMGMETYGNISWNLQEKLGIPLRLGMGSRVSGKLVQKPTRCIKKMSLKSPNVWECEWWLAHGLDCPPYTNSHHNPDHKKKHTSTMDPKCHWGLCFVGCHQVVLLDKISSWLIWFITEKTNHISLHMTPATESCVLILWHTLVFTLKSFASQFKSIIGRKFFISNHMNHMNHFIDLAAWCSV